MDYRIIYYMKEFDAFCEKYGKEVQLILFTRKE